MSQIQFNARVDSVEDVGYSSSLPGPVAGRSVSLTGQRTISVVKGNGETVSVPVDYTLSLGVLLPVAETEFFDNPGKEFTVTIAEVTP